MRCTTQVFRSGAVNVELFEKKITLSCVRYVLTGLCLTAGIWHLPSDSGVAFGQATEVSPNEDRSSPQKPSYQKIKYDPPKNTVSLPQAKYVGATEVVHLELGNMRLGKEAVFAVPIRNLSKSEVEILDISVSCGCLAPVATSTQIKRDEAVTIYLRASPDEDGAFRKRATIAFSDGEEMIFALDGKARPLFYPVDPRKGVSRSSPVTATFAVWGTFGPSPTEVTSLHPAFEVLQTKKKIKRVEFKLRVVESQIDKLAKETPVRLRVCGGGQCETVLVQLINVDVFEFKSNPILGRRLGRAVNALAIVSGNQLSSSPLTCEVADDSDVKVEIFKQSLSGERFGSYQLRLAPVDPQVDKIPLRWRQDERVVAEIDVEVGH